MREPRVFDPHPLLPHLSLADAEMKVPTAEKPGLSQALSLKPGEGWTNRVLSEISSRLLLSLLMLGFVNSDSRPNGETSDIHDWLCLLHAVCTATRE